MKHARIEIPSLAMARAEQEHQLELVRCLADAEADPDCATSWASFPDRDANWYQVSGPDEMVERFKQAAMAVVQSTLRIDIVAFDALLSPMLHDAAD